MLPTVALAVRAPTAPELVRLRAWMPSVSQEAAAPLWRVVVLGRHARIVAAAAVMPGPGAARLCWRLAGEVVERADVLPPLLASAQDAARAAGVETLRTAAMIEESSPAAAVLQGLGFVSVETQEIFEIRTADLHTYLEPLYRQLIERGRIPADARVEPLRDEWLPAARALFARHLPNHEGAAPAAVLAGDEEGYRQGESYALLVGGEVRGIVLRRKYGRVSHTGAILVARSLRGGSGWAHLALLYWGNVYSRADGTEVGRFTADADLHRHTLNFARHLKIPQVGRRGYYQCNLRQKVV